MFLAIIGIIELYSQIVKTKSQSAHSTSDNKKCLKLLCIVFCFFLIWKLNTTYTIVGSATIGYRS